MKTDNELIADEKNNSKKSGGVICITVISAFLLLTVGLGIFSFICPDREFSESENRVLAKVPEFSLSALFDGTLMTEIEDYLADQFPLRDDAISLKTAFDRTVGKKEENGVYIGENGFLFDSQIAFDKKSVKEKTALINEFSLKYKNARQIIAIAPNSSFMYEEYLPYGLALSDQEKQIETVYLSLNQSKLQTLDTVQILTELKKKDIQLYYRTDHHWTTEAAHGVFTEICNQWHLNDTVKYDFHTVSDSFEGTLSSKAGVHGTVDTVKVCVPSDSAGSYVVNFESEGRKTASLFCEDKLTQKNKYEVFLGGNYDKISIETTAPNNDTLLIVKDSYANCMIPMFTPHFSQIVIVDPRYMTESMDTIMSEYDFTHIIFLYNLNTFLEDSTLSDALSE